MRPITTDVSNQSKAPMDKVLNKSQDLSKPRKYFISHIITLYLCMRGRHTFQGMSRYGGKSDKGYRLQFERPFDYLDFNIELCLGHLSGHLLLVFGPSHPPKSGKHAPNLGKYWSGCLGKAVKGLEIGGLAVVDMEHQTAFDLEAIPTPCPKQLQSQGLSLVGHYAQTIVERATGTHTLSPYLAVDGYFAKQSFIDPIMEKTGLPLVSKLRADANLKYFYTGRQKAGRGRPRKFDGKVGTKQINKDKFVLAHQDGQVRIYQAKLWPVGPKRKINVAYVEFWEGAGFSGRYAIYFSTDMELEGLKAYQYYKARFHIEFLFRDATQHTGLAHCQASSENKMHFHVNAALTAVGTAKIAHYINNMHSVSTYSIADIKITYFTGSPGDENMLDLFFSSFQIDPGLEKNKQVISSILSYGSIAA